MNIEHFLTKEEKLVRQSAREFVNAEILPIIEDYAQDHKFPLHLVKMMGELGFCGATLPEKYDCAELSNVAYGLIMYELERGDGGIRSNVSVTSALCMYPIYLFGTEKQRQYWLPKMARGEAIGCFGLTEPDYGSDPSNLNTTAVREGNGKWRINGTKIWITNGSIADVALVWASTEEGIRGFLVEKGTPGFTTPEIERKWSMRAGITSELVLEDVIVDEEESLLPNVKPGLKAPLTCLNQGRYGISWGVLGAADACFQCALDYAKNRIQFNKPIASFQIQQEKFARLVTELSKGQIMSLHLGRLKDQEKATPSQMALAKRNNTEIARNLCIETRAILGAAGVVSDYPIMRHMANLESIYTYEGTHDILTLIIGKELTGINAFT